MATSTPGVTPVERLHDAGQDCRRYAARCADVQAAGGGGAARFDGVLPTLQDVHTALNVREEGAA